MALLLILGACEMNKLKNAQDLYDNKRFAAAVQELDAYIALAKNGAVKTRAELLRSHSYLELGQLAISRQNWQMAISFLKLANSEEADAELANIYRNLANRALAAKDIPNQLRFINAIIREIPKSEFIPEMLYRRIVILHEVYDDRETAWKDYMYLFDTYPNNSYELQARNQIKRFINFKADYAQILMRQEYYNDALSILFELARYPVLEFDFINRMISDNYQAQAESYIIDQDYLAADRNFRIAMQYFPAKKTEIDERLQSIATMFIEKGDNLLRDRDFDNALLHYQKTFDIIPDYEPALAAIDRLFTLRINIQRAGQLFLEAERSEAAARFSEAQSIYQAAYQLDNKIEYQQKIAQMQNMIEASKNPAAFAQRTIMEYKGGLLQRRINEIKKELAKKYKAEEIKDSGWKIMLSTGQYKYEARYDILSPQETYFYIWQINLRDKQIVPLNKVSDELMK